MISPEISEVHGILEKIQLAKDLYSKFKLPLKSNPEVKILFSEVERLIARSKRMMAEMGVNDLCRSCEEEEGGSCCGAGIENRYDVVLLLLNLLAGVILPISRYDKNSCFFLGPEGCQLKIRHTLCVNFLCSKIEDNLSLDQLVWLQMVLGEEMEKSFVLYETVKNLLLKLTER